METKFKEGDIIRIKSLDWYNNNKDKKGISSVAWNEFFLECYNIKQNGTE